MTLGLLRGAFLLLALGGLAVTVMVSTLPVGSAGSHAPRPIAGVAGTMAGRESSEGLLERAVERPAFRADRRRPKVAYDGTQAQASDTPGSPAIPKPALAVSGILWGPEPAALIEGVPGAEGSTVLRRGESMAGFRVTRIDGERVVIRGMDTTWSLTVRNPWP